MPTDALSTLAVATGGAFLGKFVGPVAEHYGKLALERAQQLGAKATAYLAAVGRAPQPVEPKVLLPLVQAAALETDEMLVEKWAALLANAADPAQRDNVQPNFISILRDLSALDAHVLQAIASASQGEAAEMRPYLYSHATKVQRAVGEGDGPPTKRFGIALDNLMRLRLCEGRGATKPAGRPSNTLAHLIGGHASMLARGPGKDQLAITDLGLAFLAACTPPTA